MRVGRVRAWFGGMRVFLLSGLIGEWRFRFLEGEVVADFK